MNNLGDLYRETQNLTRTERMPVLFLGHGSPMNAIEENEFVSGFRTTGRNLPTPQAILCISAHWLTEGTKLTAMEFPRTIHDFGGFPQQLFDVNYPAPGSPLLAKEAKKLIHSTDVELDHHWGLDHGAWSVLKHLYPKANIPIVQMSIDYNQSAEYHFQLAQELKTLRERGVLIVGSGNIIHNLRLVDFQNMHKDNYGYDWAIEAHSKINALLVDRNYQPLLDYKNQGKAFQLAIPTPDHYFPLLYALGLQETGEEMSLFNDKLLAGSLSMTSLKIG